MIHRDDDEDGDDDDAKGVAVEAGDGFQEEIQ
jgi:hypothetical protein